MIPQSYPLYATRFSTVDDDHVWAIIGWEPADPHHPKRAHLVAVGAGQRAGHQVVEVPDMVWADIATAEAFLAETRGSTPTISDTPLQDAMHGRGYRDPLDGLSVVVDSSLPG